MPEMLAMLPQDRQKQSLDSLFAGDTAGFLTNVVGPEGASALSMGMIPLTGRTGTGKAPITGTGALAGEGLTSSEAIDRVASLNAYNATTLPDPMRSKRRGSLFGEPGELSTKFGAG
jgi:hypothetical protein